MSIAEICRTEDVLDARGRRASETRTTADCAVANEAATLPKEESHA